MIYNKFGHKCQKIKNLKILQQKIFFNFNIFFSIICYINGKHLSKIEFN